MQCYTPSATVRRGLDAVLHDLCNGAARAGRSVTRPVQRCCPGWTQWYTTRATLLPGLAAVLPDRATLLPGLAAVLPDRATLLPGLAAVLPDRATCCPGWQQCYTRHVQRCGAGWTQCYTARVTVRRGLDAALHTPATVRRGSEATSHALSTPSRRRERQVARRGAWCADVRWRGTAAATCRSARGTAGESSSPSRTRTGARSATRACCRPSAGEPPW